LRCSTSTPTSTTRPAWTKTTTKRTKISLYGSILYNNILPTLLAAGAGYLLGRGLRPDVRSVSRLTFYIFSPCLVFTAVAHTELPGAEFGQLGIGALSVTGASALLAWLAGRALHLPRTTLATLVVAAAFGNAGNYGLAVLRFAFGEAAVARGVIYFTFSTLAVYTLGVMAASLGRRSWRDVLAQGMRLPTTYALLAAGIFRLSPLSVPVPLDRAITLLSQGAIPVMLVILGLQLASVQSWPRSQVALVGLAAFIQLGAAPLVGLALATLMGVTGPARQALVLESAMPAAVITTILAAEFDLDTRLVTGTVLVSTLLSPITLTPLIAYLQ
jgi:predicted permease